MTVTVHVPDGDLETFLSAVHWTEGAWRGAKMRDRVYIFNIQSVEHASWRWASGEVCSCGERYHVVSSADILELVDLGT